MLIYSNVRDYLKWGLAQQNYTESLPLGSREAMPLFDVGPSTEARLQKLSPESIVFLNIGGGGGLETEQLFDSLFINILVIGPQGDYDAAERLAMAVDFVLLQAVSNTNVGGAEVLYINRSGGRPSLASYDKADRYHFSGSYITEAASDLVR